MLGAVTTACPLLIPQLTSATAQVCTDRSQAVKLPLLHFVHSPFPPSLPPSPFPPFPPLATDPCQSGFHNCDPNALCSWNQTTDGVTCQCKEGFSGNGFVCTGPCATASCHPQASCSLDESTQQPVCTCNTGLVGDGRECFLCNSTCDEESADCGLRGSTVYCSCKEGFVMARGECIQDGEMEDFCCSSW